MDRIELKELAKSKIKGNVSTLFFSYFAVVFIVSLINMIISFIFLLIKPSLFLDQDTLYIIVRTSVMLFIDIILMSLILIGVNNYYLTFIEEDSASFSDYFLPMTFGFGAIIKNICSVLLKNILVLLGSILIIPGIVLGLAYSQVLFIRAENPDMGIIESLRESRRIMKGNKSALFILQLSFIGWSLLIPFTLGFITIYLTPYILTTNALFYYNLNNHDLSSKTKKVIVSETKFEVKAVNAVFKPNLNNAAAYKPKPKTDITPIQEDSMFFSSDDKKVD